MTEMESAVEELRAVAASARELAIAFQPAPGERDTVTIPVSMARRLAELLSAGADAMLEVASRAEAP